MLSLLMTLVVLISAYLIGSVCSAIIVCRLFDLPDPRTEGSKNPGATNVLRIAGKQYAAIVLIGDMLKGLLPVLLAKIFGASITLLGFTCLAAVIGHIYPIFFNFKGGKGVATAFGALLALHFMLGVVAIVIWLVIANFSHYVSLASIVALLFVPFVSIPMIGSPNAFIPLMIVTILVLFKHAANINRLIDGKESKTNLRSQIQSTMPHETEAPASKASSVKSPAAEKIKTGKATKKREEQSSKSTKNTSKENINTPKKTK